MAKIKNPVIIISGASGLTKYHVTQTIAGDTCTLDLVSDSVETTNNYYGASIIDTTANTQQIYLISEVGS